MRSIYNPLIRCTDGWSSSRRRTDRNLYNSKTLPSYALVYTYTHCVFFLQVQHSHSSITESCWELWNLSACCSGRQADLMKTTDVAYSSTAFNLLTEPCACPCKLRHCLITLSVLYLASAWQRRFGETCLTEITQKKRGKLLHSNGGKSMMGLIRLSTTMNFKSNGEKKAFFSWEESVRTGYLMNVLKTLQIKSKKLFAIYISPFFLKLCSKFQREWLQ